MVYSRQQTAAVIRNIRAHAKAGKCTDARHALNQLISHGRKIKHSTVRGLWKTVEWCKWKPQGRRG